MSSGRMVVAGENAVMVRKGAEREKWVRYATESRHMFIPAAWEDDDVRLCERPQSEY